MVSFSSSVLRTERDREIERERERGGEKGGQF